MKLKHAIEHIRNCLEMRRVLRGHDSPNLDNLYWYDLRLRDAVTWRGIARVLWWNLTQRRDDEIAGNYGLVNLYYGEPVGDGLSTSGATVWHCRSLDSQPWMDAPDAAARELEANADAIVAEYRNAMHQLGTHPDNESLTDRGKWTGMFLFQARGERNEALCRLCETTARVVGELGPCRNFGFTMFSGVEPHTHITAHCGSSNLRMRYHLGVDVPEPEAARIRVGTEWRHWQEKKVIAFDDSFEHEVVHDGEKDRVVLVVDLWHPSLSEEDKAVLDAPIFQRFGKAAA
ncbi:MAG: aspartyl/asparaginyl beta-hydroxylase domain-containing protein [Gammaproteobacteria bacterium]|nr:aspartyl/asparaginyl beta-hydroxylase domain-containing protein [Gammaproteobacteria bacterium]